MVAGKEVEVGLGMKGLEVVEKGAVEYWRVGGVGSRHVSSDISNPY